MTVELEAELLEALTAELPRIVSGTRAEVGEIPGFNWEAFGTILAPLFLQAYIRGLKDGEGHGIDLAVESLQALAGKDGLPPNLKPGLLIAVKTLPRLKGV